MRRPGTIQRSLAAGLAGMLLLLAACGPATTEFRTDRTIVEDEILHLRLTGITLKGLDFQCENRSEHTIQVYMDIGLDGIQADLIGDMNDTRIAPGGTEAIHYEGTLEEAEHATLSVTGTVYDPETQEIVETFDDSGIPLDGASHPEHVKKGKVIYDEEGVQISYLGAEEEGAVFSVFNSRKEPLLFGTTRFHFNDDPGDYGGARKNIPGLTRARYVVRIRDKNPDYVAKDLIYFSANFLLQRKGEEDILRFKIEYPF